MNFDPDYDLSAQTYNIPIQEDLIDPLNNVFISSQLLNKRKYLYKHNEEKLNAGI